MAPSPTNIEQEKLLKLAEEYRSGGYDVVFQPSSDKLPNFLQGYRPDLLARRNGESIVIEVKSRANLDTSTIQYLRAIDQSLDEHSGWRLKLVMADSQNFVLPDEVESSFQEEEIASQLRSVKDFASQHPQSAFLYAWSLTEAACRLVIHHEGIGLKQATPRYLIKQLMTEGVISNSDYQLLENALALRNAVAHGYKSRSVTEHSVNELVSVAEQLLNDLHSDAAVV